MTFLREYRFHPRRGWKFDFAFPKKKVAIEMQGYGPGHTSYIGMLKDYEKHNEALKMGWIVIYLMSEHVKEKNRSKTIKLIINILETR